MLTAAAAAVTKRARLILAAAILVAGVTIAATLILQPPDVNFPRRAAASINGLWSQWTLGDYESVLRDVRAIRARDRATGGRDLAVLLRFEGWTHDALADRTSIESDRAAYAASAKQAWQELLRITDPTTDLQAVRPDSDSSRLDTNETDQANAFADAAERDYWRAYAYVGLDQPGQAERSFRACIEHDRQAIAAGTRALTDRIACAHAAIGEHEQALEALRRMLAAHSTTFTYLERHLAFEGLFDDPRFQALTDASANTRNFGSRVRALLGQNAEDIAREYANRQCNLDEPWNETSAERWRFAAQLETDPERRTRLWERALVLAIPGPGLSRPSYDKLRAKVLESRSLDGVPNVYRPHFEDSLEPDSGLSDHTPPGSLLEPGERPAVTAELIATMSVTQRYEAAWAYLGLGQPEDARLLFAAAARALIGDAVPTPPVLEEDALAAGNNAEWESQDAFLAALARPFDEAEAAGTAVGRTPGPSNHFNLACYLAMAGQHEAAVLALQRALEGRELVRDRGWILWDPDIHPIRDDPRVQDIILQIPGVQSYYSEFNRTD